SSKFDKLSEDKKKKIVNNSEKMLYLIYKAYNTEKKPLPIEAIAYQVLWLLEKDELMAKADMGLASQSIEGMTQTFRKQDKTVAPEVKRILKKRVGTYYLAV